MPAPSRRLSAALLLSLLIHGGAFMTLRYRASSPVPVIVPPVPIEVTLLPPTLPAVAAPVAPPKPAEPPKPVAAKPPPEKKAPPRPVKPAPEPRRAAPTKVPKPAPEPAPAAAPAAPVVVATPTPNPASEAPVAPPAPPAPPVHTGASIPASYAATNRPPVQPPRSIRNGEEGTVMLRVQVRADGSAGEVQIAQSSGFPMLDDAAKSAVQNWRFHPATLDGKPITEWFRVPINFKLSN